MLYAIHVLFANAVTLLNCTALDAAERSSILVGSEEALDWAVAKLAAAGIRE